MVAIALGVVGLLVVASLGIVFLLALGGAVAWQASGMVERLFLLSQLVWTAWAVAATRPLER